MPRSSLAALLLAFSACSTPAQQAAPAHQTVIPRYEVMIPPAMPFACDLEAAPVGSWADYEERGALTATTRFALVAKGPAGTTIERTYDLQFPDVVTAYGFPPGKGPPAQITKAVMQDGGFDPMEMQLSPQRRDWRLDPQALVGSEEITVRAGSFHARRYHYLTRFGENVDAWIGDTAWPTCLIKLDAEQKQARPPPDRFGYELVTMGGDAQPRITKSAVPYDLEVLKKRDDEQRIRQHRPDNAPRVGDTIAP